MIEVKPVPAFRDNYIWLIKNPGTGAVAIVDPGDPVPVMEEISKSKLTPVAILVTHHHHDHVGGVTRLADFYRVPVYGPAAESIPGKTVAVKDGDRVTLSELDITFDVLEVPGHTAGHIAYYGGKMLFIGDTLFMAGCGRLFEGTATQMHHSLHRVANLPEETQVYCAHEYTLANLRFARAVEPDNRDIEARARHCAALREQHVPTVPGTIASERKTNPFLRVATPGVIAAAERHAGRALDQEVDVFAVIRKWKDNF